MEMRAFGGEPGAVFFVFAYPLLMMTVFSSVFDQSRQIVDPSGTVVITFAHYFLPGVVATAVVLSSVQLIGIQVAQDRESGMLKRMRATPLPPMAYFLGLLGQVVVSLTLQIVLLLVAAQFIWKVPMPTDPSVWLTFAWVCLASSAAGAAAGIAIGGLMPSARTASAFLIPFVLLLQFISGVFVAFPDLPMWMKNLSAMFSLKWTAQGFRSVFLPEAFAAAEPVGNWQHGMIALVLLAWIAVWAVVAQRTFRWYPQNAR
jgi:ABC-2 type transport system permease protein